MTDGPGDITLLLRRARDPGDGDARQRLFLLVEQTLRDIAERRLRRLPPGHTVQATELIGEAFLRLLDRRDGGGEDRGEFFRVAHGVMRRILCDHVRATLRRRQVPLGLDEQARLPDNRAEAPDARPQRHELLLSLLEALGKLEADDADAAAVFELRFFGGRCLALGPARGDIHALAPGAELLPFGEVADVFGIPRSTAFVHWSRAVERLQAELQAFAPADYREPPHDR